MHLIDFASLEEEELAVKGNIENDIHYSYHIFTFK